MVIKKGTNKTNIFSLHYQERRAKRRKPSSIPTCWPQGVEYPLGLLRQPEAPLLNTSMPFAGGSQRAIEEIVIKLRTPAITKQISSYHCWAAALSSLFLTTMTTSDLEIYQYTAEKIYNRVWMHPRQGDLLRHNGDPKTVYPSLREVDFVYHNIFGLYGVEAISSSQLWSHLEAKLKERKYVVLSYQLHQSSWWHSVIVYGLIKVGNEQKIIIMDPNEYIVPQLRSEPLKNFVNYSYIGWREDANMDSQL